MKIISLKMILFKNLTFFKLYVYLKITLLIAFFVIRLVENILDVNLKNFFTISLVDCKVEEWLGKLSSLAITPFFGTGFLVNAHYIDFFELCVLTISLENIWVLSIYY